MLGFAPAPALFAARVYPTFNSIQCSEQATADFMRELIEAIGVDSTSGVRNMAAGLISNIQKAKFSGTKAKTVSLTDDDWAAVKDSQVGKTMEKFTNREVISAYTDARIIQSLMYDDALSAAATRIGCLHHLALNAKGACEIGGQFGGRKISVGGKMAKAVGNLLNQGDVMPTEERLVQIEDFSRIPFSAAEMRTNLGILVFAELALGRHLGTVLAILGPYSRMENDDEYKEIINDLSATFCCDLIREGSGMTVLKPVPHAGIKDGSRIAIGMTDATEVSISAYALSVSRETWESDDDTDIRSKLAIHKIVSRPLAANLGTPEPAITENYAQLLYHNEVDFVSGGADRLLVSDSSNAIYPEIEIHRGTTKARERALSANLVNTLKPGLTRAHVHGTFVEFADYSTRATRTFRASRFQARFSDVNA